MIIDDFIARLVRTPEHLHSSSEVANTRTKLCESCDRRVSFMGADKCSECGCFVYLKVRFRNSKCPLGSWDAMASVDRAYDNIGEQNA